MISTLDKKLEAKIEKLQDHLKDLKAQHQELKTELNISADDDVQASVESYQNEMKHHITQLKHYNELKDTSMRLIQLIADQRQVTLRTIMDEMGINDAM